MAKVKVCPQCKEGGFVKGDSVWDICPECRKKGEIKKWCHICKGFSNIDTLACTHCGNTNIHDAFVQTFYLTPMGERTVNKLQVESLLEEIKH